MTRRRYGSKLTLMLWTLIALADLAILVSAADLRTAVITMVTLLMVTGAAVAVWSWLRAEALTTNVQRRA